MSINVSDYTNREISKYTKLVENEERQMDSRKKVNKLTPSPIYSQVFSVDHCYLFKNYFLVKLNQFTCTFVRIDEMVFGMQMASYELKAICLETEIRVVSTIQFYAYFICYFRFFFSLSHCLLVSPNFLFIYIYFFLFFFGSFLHFFVRFWFFIILFYFI